jgi:hypothetical protein
MMEAVRTSETSVDNHFTRQYNPEDSSEHHTRRREDLKSHIYEYTLSCGSAVCHRELLQDKHLNTSSVPNSDLLPASEANGKIPLLSCCDRELKFIQM